MMKRRDFLKRSAAAGVGFWAAGRNLRAQETSPNEKLNVGCIGVGGRGAASVEGTQQENIVALCDVDARTLDKCAAKFPNARKYKDFRKMLEEEKTLDAVTVATPDHTHASAAAMALGLGRHVYCEKPLTHSIHEARVLTRLAAGSKRATQMGNQGHSSEFRRRLVEILQAGVIGNVTEVHAWTDRPWWPQGINRPSKTDPVPPELDWDLWLGPAPERPYVRDTYHAFKWRGWWDFGTGALGDMGCHIMDAAFWGLKLGSPVSVEAVGEPHNPESGPKWSVVTLQFPARGELAPVKFVWYDGRKDGKPNQPPGAPAEGVNLSLNGNILIGDKGKIVVLDEQGSKWVLLPEEKFKDVPLPDPTLPRVPNGANGHHQEWIKACKGGPPCLCDFSYAGPFTETVLLGIVAFRAGKKLEWDGPNAKASNCPEAGQYIAREYRKGWTL